MDYDMKEIENIKSKYVLTEEQYNEMYEKCKYISFYNCTSQENPTGIFVGGQTGSGKGGIDVFSKQEFLNNGQNAAILDVDVYRALHPYTKEILNKYPTIYTDITAKVTGRILKNLISDSIKENYNFIFEGTLRNTEALETMRNMPKHYRKIVRVMATSSSESLLTAFERNYQQIAISGYGRFTNVETHNITYNGVLNTIQAIEQSNEDIIIEIFKRGKDMTSPIKIFSSTISKELPSTVLKQERTKDINQLVEKRKLRLNNLLRLLTPKDDFERTQLEKLKQEFC